MVHDPSLPVAQLFRSLSSCATTLLPTAIGLSDSNTFGHPPQPLASICTLAASHETRRTEYTIRLSMLRGLICRGGPLSLLCLTPLTRACVADGENIATYCAAQTRTLAECFPTPTFAQACNYAKSSWGASCWYNYCEDWQPSTPAQGYTAALSAKNAACAVWLAAAQSADNAATVTCNPSALTDGTAAPAGITSFPPLTWTSISAAFYSKGSYVPTWGPPVASSTDLPEGSTSWTANTEYIWETIFIDDLDSPSATPPAASSCECAQTTTYATNSGGVNNGDPSGSYTSSDTAPPAPTSFVGSNQSSGTTPVQQTSPAEQEPSANSPQNNTIPPISPASGAVSTGNISGQTNSGRTPRYSPTLVFLFFLASVDLSAG